MQDSVRLNGFTPHCRAGIQACSNSNPKWIAFMVRSPWGVTGGRGTHSPRCPGAFAQVTLDVAAIATETSAGQPSAGMLASSRAKSSRGAAAVCFSAEVLIVTSESSGINLTKIVS